MLQIKHLTKTYGSTLAVDDLSFDVADGDIFGFIGSNGAGKTTTIKAIAGIHSFDGGEIIIDGMSISSRPLDCKRVMAYIPDNPDIYEFMTGEAYINFIANIYGVPQKTRLELTEKYSKGLELDEALASPVSSYSHGMKQKLTLIAAFVHQPKLFLLDEPFVGLDPRAAFTLKEYMHELTAQGTSIFFSSHGLEVVQKLCNRIGIIKGGKLLECGPTEEITGRKSLEDVFLELTDDEPGKAESGLQ